MVIIKLIVLVTFVGVTLGSNVRDPQVPSLYAATVSKDETLKGPQEVHDAYIVKQEVKPTDHYRFGYEIHYPKIDTTVSHYEMRYNDVNLGVYTKVETKTGHRSTVNYTIDATNGYREAVYPGSLGELTTLEYAHFTSPVATATPPNDGMVAFKNFQIDDTENIYKYSPVAKSAHRTYKLLQGFFGFTSKNQVSWGYDIQGNRSQYEIQRDGIAEGRMVLLNADGCVSSMDYKADANNFNVSTIRHFGKPDISQLYLNPQHYPLVLQIAFGSSACGV